MRERGPLDPDFAPGDDVAFVLVGDTHKQTGTVVEALLEAREVCYRVTGTNGKPFLLGQSLLELLP